MIEPRFANATTGNDLIEQAIGFGLDIDTSEWMLRDGENPTDRTVRVFADRLTRLDRWGLKEVRPDLLTPSLHLLRPRQTIVLVRDIRSVAVSLVEKTEADADPRYDRGWLHSYLRDSPRAILDLMNRLGDAANRVVRYEDLVADVSERTLLAEWLDWPLDGVPDRHLADLYKRRREVQLHAGAVTTQALERYATSTSERALTTADWAANENREFQKRFGYQS